MRQVLGPGALGRPRGIGWRGRWEGGSGWGIHVTPWLIHVNVWQNPLKCCEVISLQLIKINEKQKKQSLPHWDVMGVNEVTSVKHLLHSQGSSIDGNLLCTVPGARKCTWNAIPTVGFGRSGTDNIIIINLKELTIQEKVTHKKYIKTQEKLST